MSDKFAWEKLSRRRAASRARSADAEERKWNRAVQLAHKQQRESRGGTKPSTAIRTVDGYPLDCERCGHCVSTVTVMRTRQGNPLLRADCSSCGKYIKFIRASHLRRFERDTGLTATA